MDPQCVEGASQQERYGPRAPQQEVHVCGPPLAGELADTLRGLPDQHRGIFRRQAAVPHRPEVDHRSQVTRVSSGEPLKRRITPRWQQVEEYRHWSLRGLAVRVGDLSK